LANACKSGPGADKLKGGGGKDRFNCGGGKDKVMPALGECGSLSRGRRPSTAALDQFPRRAVVQGFEREMGWSDLARFRVGDGSFHPGAYTY
jgi:hypothetical protein